MVVSQLLYDQLDPVFGLEASLSGVRVFIVYLNSVASYFRIPLPLCSNF